MSEFLIPTQPDMVRDIHPIAVSEELHALTLDDYAHLKLDGLLRSERAIKYQDPARMTEASMGSQREVLTELQRMFVAMDLHDAYKQQDTIDRGDDGLLSSLAVPERGRRLLIDPILDRESTDRAIVVTDTGLNVYGLGLITPSANVREFVRTKRRFVTAGEPITEGMLLRGFTKRPTKALVGFMAISLLLTAQELTQGSSDNVVVASPSSKKNKVGKELLGYTDEHIASDVIAGVERGVPGNTIVHPMQRDVVHIDLISAA